MENRPNKEGAKSPSTKRKIVIRTQFSRWTPKPDSKQFGKSQTVPDMSLTIKELLDGHTRGIDLDPERREGLYLEEPIPVITDLTDLDAHRDAVIEQTEETKAELIKSREERLKQAQEAKEEKAKARQEQEDRLLEKLRSERK